ncbi:MAG: hypothetical protein FWD71_00470 [Oscillospiraceae bacterium]|nr:hypothetical protein [Oscillospiraceae bacterium]
MIIKYKENWEETKKRMDAFWNKEYIDRCCLSIKLRKDKSDLSYNSDPLVLSKSEYTLEETRTDSDYIFRHFDHYTKNTIHLAEAIPSLMPGFGVAAQACYFGAKQIHAPDTIWFESVIDEPDINKLVYDKDEVALNAHKKLTSDLSERAKGLFMVGMNDNCGIIDALSNLRDNAALLVDMVDNPEFVEAARDKITDVWKKTQKQFYDLSKGSNDGGSSHSWMQTWSRGIHGQLQCDFSVMISPAFYERFVLPELEACTSFYDNSTYHLDGQEQIRHLDLILSVKRLDNIQWTAVAGQPRMSNFIDVFHKIQKAGKGLVLAPDLDEVPFLLKNLSHKGLIIVVSGIKDIDEANDLIKLAEKCAHL